MELQLLISTQRLPSARYLTEVLDCIALEELVEYISGYLRTELNNIVQVNKPVVGFIECIAVSQISVIEPPVASLTVIHITFLPILLKYRCISMNVHCSRVVIAKMGKSITTTVPKVTET